ncbi:MAG TPA: molybdate ABC transporter substrate-binding protein [Thermoanaerobaculia bacterium]|jgi:molybdate transport system substrate-binding protein
MTRHSRHLSLALSLSLVLTGPAAGEKATVAVAANFAEVVERLEADFMRETGHELTFVAGSTGKLYAQIANGAPFDVLLSADHARPEVLERDGLAVAGSRFTYSFGRLTLWSAEPGRVGEDGAATLREGAFRRIAIANPDLAPYGLAARQTLESLELWDSVKGEIVMGQSIGQAHALVASGSVELGFVALSYVLSPRNEIPGSRWDVPPSLHAPIRQDAVLLSRAADNQAARAFLAFLRSAEAKAVIETYGYAVE